MKKDVTVKELRKFCKEQYSCNECPLDSECGYYINLDTLNGNYNKLCDLLDSVLEIYNTEVKEK